VAVNTPAEERERLEANLKQRLAVAAARDATYLPVIPGPHADCIGLASYRSDVLGATPQCVARIVRLFARCCGADRLLLGLLRDTASYV
jgi:hypothetical protein